MEVDKTDNSNTMDNSSENVCSIKETADNDVNEMAKSSSLEDGSTDKNKEKANINEKGGEDTNIIKNSDEIMQIDETETSEVTDLKESCPSNDEPAEKNESKSDIKGKNGEDTNEVKDSDESWSSMELPWNTMDESMQVDDETETSGAKEIKKSDLSNYEPAGKNKSNPDIKEKAEDGENINIVNNSDKAMQIDKTETSELAEMKEISSANEPIEKVPEASENEEGPVTQTPVKDEEIINSTISMNDNTSGKPSIDKNIENQDQIKGNDINKTTKPIGMDLNVTGNESNHKKGTESDKNNVKSLDDNPPSKILNAEELFRAMDVYFCNYCTKIFITQKTYKDHVATNHECTNNGNFEKTEDLEIEEKGKWRDILKEKRRHEEKQKRRAERKEAEKKKASVVSKSTGKEKNKLEDSLLPQKKSDTNILQNEKSKSEKTCIDEKKLSEECLSK